MEENLILNTLNQKSKKELINYLSNFYLEYRHTLNFPSDITFGIEIEAIVKKLTESVKQTDYMVYYNDIKNQTAKTFIVAPEDFDDKVCAGELISPILTNTKENWETIKKAIIDFQNYSGATTSYHTSGHIHGSSNLLKEGDILRLVRLYSAFEKIIYRFAAGEYINIRPGVSSYALPIAQKIKKHNPTTDEEVLNLLCHKDPHIAERMGYKENPTFRYNGLNFLNIVLGLKDTVEFRVPNGTLNHIIWQNNINFFIHLLLSVSSERYDEELIDYYLKKVESNRELTNTVVAKYNKYLNIEEAFVLADILFSNTLDKLYFLKGYIKDGKIAEKSLPLTKAKTYTKSNN